MSSVMDLHAAQLAVEMMIVDQGRYVTILFAPLVVELILNVHLIRLVLIINVLTLAIHQLHVVAILFVQLKVTEFSVYVQIT